VLIQRAVKTPIARVERMVGLHAFGDLTPAQCRHELSIRKKMPGRLVFIGSCAGHTPYVHIPTYCGTKAE